MSWLDPIGDEVRRELDRFSPAGAGMAAIVAAWPAAVGPAIARNAWPARLARDGRLHVATSSSAWTYELTQLRGEIGEKLAAAVGPEHAPKDLRFAPGPLPEPAQDTAEPEDAKAVRADPAAVARGDEVAAGIGDETLRKLVARAAAASLQRAADDRSVW